MSTIHVKKRNGHLEKYNIDKIHRVINWAIDGIANVSLSDIEINANLNITENISTKEIHKVLIESASNLITLDNPNYQYVAGRLLNYQLRKDVWGGKHAPRLLDVIHAGVRKKIYDPAILTKYTESEINKIGEYVY